MQAHWERQQHQLRLCCRHLHVPARPAASAAAAAAIAAAAIAAAAIAAAAAAAAGEVVRYSVRC